MGRDDFVREIEAQRRAAAQKLEPERRVAQELDIARRVQARLFPQTLPQLDTLEYAGIASRPARWAAIITTFWTSAARASAW